MRSIISTTPLLQVSPPITKSPWRQCHHPQDQETPCLVFVSFSSGESDFYEHHWSVFQSKADLLHFIQYGVLPAFAYHAYYPPQKTQEELYIPQISTEQLLQEISQSDLPPHKSLISFLKELQKLEHQPDELLCGQALFDFAHRWNKQRFFLPFQCQLHVFENVSVLQEELKELYWEEALFQEELGLTPKEWDHLCRDASQSPFAMNRLFSLLNEKVSTL